MSLRSAFRPSTAVSAIASQKLVRQRSATTTLASSWTEQFETTEKIRDLQRQVLEAAARRPRTRDDLAGRLHDLRFGPFSTANCPPIVEYDRESEARAAEDRGLLSEG